MESLRKARDLLFASTLVLVAIGVVMIYSASAIYANDEMKDSAYFLKRHLGYLALGGFLAYLASAINTQKLRKHAKKILGVLIALLVLVLIPHVGHSSGGARRWFKVLGFTFQPSEFLKLALIFYFADFLERRREVLTDLKRVVVPASMVVALCAGLVLLQPDLGTAVTVALVAFVLFFAAGFKGKVLLTVVLLAIPALAFATLSKPYRRKRMLAFFNPWDDPRGVGFQIIQSFLAFGSGGIFGVGLGQSQQKLFYLPASHTDFIFSIIGEELGFLGAGAVVVLFTAFVFAGMVIVMRAPSFFSQLFALGIVGMIALEAAINIGVSVGALPTKGLSLPFISYGGSALLVNLMAVGFLVNISKETPHGSQGAP